MIARPWFIVPMTGRYSPLNYLNKLEKI